MSALARISISEADPTWIISTSGFDGVVYLCTLACGTWEMKSVSLHISVISHLNTSQGTLEQALADHRPEGKCSVTLNQSLFGTLLILL